MDNYNNIMNQQYGNIVYSNNMMQPNIPIQQNPPLIPENTQHNLQNDSRMPPNLMEPPGMEMVNANTNLTSDSMRIADIPMERMQNSFAESSGNGGYTNYVTNMSTNVNDVHSISIPQPKMHENEMTEVDAQNMLQDDKYKQHTAENVEPIMPQQQYEPVIPPESNPPVMETDSAVPNIDLQNNEDFKLDEEKNPIQPENPLDNINKEDVQGSNPESIAEPAEKGNDKDEFTESSKVEAEFVQSSTIENEFVQSSTIEDEFVQSSKHEDECVEPSKDESEIPEAPKIEEVKITEVPEVCDAKESTELKDPELEDKKEEEAEEEGEEKEISLDVNMEKPIEQEDYSTMCRVCLKTNLTDLIDLCNQDGVLKILDKVMLCASVQIANNDGLPCHICESCVNKLHVAYDFKITCETSDVELRKRLNIAVPKTVVKTEFVLIECDDQDYNLDESEQEKPRTKRKYKEESDDYFVSDSMDDSGSDSSFSLNKSKSKKKTKRRTRSTSKRQLPKRERRSKEWKHDVVLTPEAPRKRTKYVVDPDDDKPLITIKKIKSDEKTSKHACDICNKTFPYQSFLKQHMLTHQNKDSIIKCKFCTAKFTLQEDYKQHTLDYHAEDLDDDYPIVTPKEKKYKKSLVKAESGDEEVKERTPRERKSHKCPYCDTVCSSALQLKTHKRSHVGEKPFVCHICQKPFKQTVSLDAHIKRHAEDKSLQCEHCQKICASKSDLNRHIKTEHMDQKHFECAVCNKEFPTKVKLDKHVVKHEKEEEELSTKENKEKKTPSTKDLFKTIAPITSTYWSDSFSD